MIEILWRDDSGPKPIWREFPDLFITWPHLCNLFGLFNNRYAVRVKTDSGYIVNQDGLRKSYRKAGHKCTMLADMATHGGTLEEYA